jgi:hypothetical protein
MPDFFLQTSLALEDTNILQVTFCICCWSNIEVEEAEVIKMIKTCMEEE